MPEFDALEKVVGKVKNIGSSVRKIASWIESAQWKAPENPFGKNLFSGTKNLVSLNKKYRELFPQFEKNRSLLNYWYLSQRVVIMKNFIEGVDILQQSYIDLDRRKSIFEKEIKERPERVPTSKELLEEYVDPTTGQFDPNKKSKKKQQEEADERMRKSFEELEKEINSELKTLLRELGILKEVLSDQNYMNDKIKFTGELRKNYETALKKTKDKLLLYEEEVRTGEEKEKVQKSEDAFLSGNLNARKKRIKFRIKK